jgi:putative exosortase-associated protein (TIGR04073 family)
MTAMRVLIGAGVAAGFLGVVAATAMAGETWAATADESYCATGPCQKLTRGLINTAAGLPGEMVVNVFGGTLGGGPHDGLLSVGKGVITGLVDGVIKGGIRTGIGLVELVTSPVPINGTYESLIDPELPF